VANSKRGLVPIELGDGVVHELRFPNSAMRSLQERFKLKTPGEVWQSMAAWSVDDWTEVIRLGLHYGSDADITSEAVDDLIIGTEMPYYQACLLGAITSALEGRDVGDRVQRIIDKTLLQAEGAATASGGGAVNP